MATPVGHSLLGVAVYLLAERRLSVPCGWHCHGASRSLGLPPMLALCGCLFLANLPDLDLLFPLFIGEGISSAYHRGVTHTAAFAVLIGALAALGCGVTRQRCAVFAGLLATALVASHLALDMLTHDVRPPHGVPLYWPITDTHVMAGWTPFLPSIHGSIEALFSITNLKSVLWDTLLMGPLVLISYGWSRRVAR